MRKQQFLLVYTFFSILLVVGCVGCNHDEDTDIIDYPVSTPFVDFLEITEYSEKVKLRKNAIDLLVENKTKDCIVFQPDYGIEMYTTFNNTWERIPNMVEYMTGTEITLGVSSEYPPYATVLVLPDYSKFDEKPKNLRIVLQAKLCRGGVPSGELVSDYIDIELEK